MLKTVSLILPVLIPSWRFFKTIEPSPRVQWALVTGNESAQIEWQDFRPRPLVVTPLVMFCRMFWNPTWNDTLFVVSCAERIGQGPTAHSIHEINRRILSDLKTMSLDTSDKLVQFRLILIHRSATGLSQKETFRSEAIPATGHQTP